MDTLTRRKPTADQVFGDNKTPIVEVLAADFAELNAEAAALVAKAAALDKPVANDEGQGALGDMILALRALWKKADGIRETEKKPILDAGRDLDKWFKDALAEVVSAGQKLQTHADDYVRKKAAEERAKAAREAELARAKAEDERLKAEAAKTAQGAANADARAEQHEAKAERLEAAASASTAELVKTRVGGVTASAKGAWVGKIVDYPAAIAPLGALGNFLKREAIEAALNSMAKVQKDGASWPGVNFMQEEKAAFRR